MDNLNIGALSDQLKLDEGIRLKPYTDTVGKLTIGVGRNLSDNGISMEEAHDMLMHDISEVIKQLDRTLPWWRNMTALRQAVLANMCFNLGMTKLLTFQNTLAYMQAGDYANAAKGMLQSKWADQVGQRAVRLSAQMAKG